MVLGSDTVGLQRTPSLAYPGPPIPWRSCELIPSPLSRGSRPCRPWCPCCLLGPFLDLVQQDSVRSRRVRREPHHLPDPREWQLAGVFAEVAPDRKPPAPRI